MLSTEIPHERIFVAEVPRLRELGCFGHPEFWQIRLHALHYFFAWGISVLSKLKLQFVRIYVSIVLPTDIWKIPMNTVFLEGLDGYLVASFPLAVSPLRLLTICHCI